MNRSVCVHLSGVLAISHFAPPMLANRAAGLVNGYPDRSTTMGKPLGKLLCPRGQRIEAVRAAIRPRCGVDTHVVADELHALHGEHERSMGGTDGPSIHEAMCSIGQLVSCDCIALGAWTHIAAVVDGSALTIQLSHDGVPTVSASAMAEFMPGNPYLYMGRWAGSGRPLVGVLDEVALFDRALSSADVAQLYMGVVP